MASSTSAVVVDAELLQDAPQVPPESISYYGFKRAASDVRELARQLGLSRIILGGHDWYALITLLDLEPDLCVSGGVRLPTE